MYVGNAFGVASLLEVAASNFGVALSLAFGWTSVVPPLLPRTLLAGVDASLFESSASALRSFSDSLAFFSSSAFLSASATVSSNFFLALVNSSICLLTSSTVAFSFLILL